jgi:hypothetical protein
MRQQLGLQMGQINQVNSVIDPMIAEGGMSPGEESALTSLAVNQLPQDFRQTEGMINQNLAARGISGGTGGAGSGDIGRQFGNLGAMEDYLKNTALTNVQLQKASQLRNLLGIKMGVANMFGQNTGMFNSGGLNALNSGVTAAHNADMASTGMWGALLGAGVNLGTSFIPKPGGGTSNG